MTRINVIPPKLLTDSWLLAEYREMPRISNLAKYVVHPAEYTLGKGHVVFFYNKGLYLKQRFDDILQELVKRGYNCKFDSYRLHPDGLNDEWYPNSAAIAINMQRLVEKFQIGQKHTLYRQPISCQEWQQLIAKENL